MDEGCITVYQQPFATFAKKQQQKYYHTNTNYHCPEAMALGIPIFV